MAELPPNNPNLNPHLRAELKRNRAPDRFEAPDGVKAAKVESVAVMPPQPLGVTTQRELWHSRRAGTPEPPNKISRYAQHAVFRPQTPDDYGWFFTLFPGHDVRRAGPVAKGYTRSPGTMPWM